MMSHVYDSQKRIRIALRPITLDCRADAWFSQNEVREIRRKHCLRICLELLDDEPFEGYVVNVGVGVEELELDVDEALLSKMNKISSWSHFCSSVYARRRCPPHHRPPWSVCALT
jgi:hypothetical protein